jgi:hypothetical protein
MSGKKLNVHKQMTEIDNFLNVLSSTASTVSMHRRELFQQLLNYMYNSKENIDFKGNYSNFRRIVRDLGFRW